MKKNLMSILTLTLVTVLASCGGSFPRPTVPQADRPIIFFNRQPKTSDNAGVADLTNVHNTYYVGSASVGQGAAQGQIIKDWYEANKDSAAFRASIADGELGYAILVGEDGNPEAADRTAGSVAAFNEIAAAAGVTAAEVIKVTAVDGTGPWNDSVAKTQVERWMGDSTLKPRIDFISSNNDGMAIAASSANGLTPGLPIIGFDALTAADDMIKEGTLAGSVSQNGDDQALAVALLASNLIAGTTPVIQQDIGTGRNLNLEFLNQHIVQSQFAAVTAANADSLKPGNYIDVQPNAAVQGKTMLVAYYSQNDNFIKETFTAALPKYAADLGYRVETVAGDGVDDTDLLNRIKQKITERGGYDAYAFNIITHSNFQQYIDAVRN